MVRKGTTCNGENLIWDQACLHITSSFPITVYGQVTECQECDIIKWVDVPPSNEVTVSTIYKTKLLFENASSVNCSIIYQFLEHGIYGINFHNINSTELCPDIFIKVEPDNANFPLFVLIWTLAAIFTLWLIGTCTKQVLSLSCIRSYVAFREFQADFGRTSDDSRRLLNLEFEPSNPSTFSRVNSVDTLRGITITLMLFVNAGGGKYAIFEHSPWNGLTVADVIFPWFAWIMGFSLVLFTKSQLRANRSKNQVFSRIMQRSLTLITLGIILNSGCSNDLNILRIPGVLQRLGLSYFIVASMQLLFITAENTVNGLQSFLRLVLFNTVASWLKWIIMFFLVGLHCYITFLMEVPGCPTGYLGPGGLHKHGNYWNCTGGAAAYIDKIVFGKNHMYRFPTPKNIYHGGPVDPEGLLGTLTTCLTVFLGTQIGQVFQNFRGYRERYIRLLIWSIIMGITAGSLTAFTKEGGVIPINKNLWSLSFVLSTASLATLGLTVLFIIIDYYMIWNGAPFISVGKNGILLYVGSQLAQNLFPWSWQPLYDASTHSEFLFMNTWSTSLWVFIAVIIDKYRIYLSV